MGQSIDIGWHQGWYPSFKEFPYKEMITNKTASLFGCCATIGTFLAGASTPMVEEANNIGTSIGVLFQMVNDYVDIFGNPTTLGRPLYDDFREGKLTEPVIHLLNYLHSDADFEAITRILNALNMRDKQETNWIWLVDMMKQYNIPNILKAEFAELSEDIIVRVKSLNGKGSAVMDIALLLQAIIKRALI